MAIVYRIEKKMGMTCVLWDGKVTADEFLAHIRRLVSDPDWPSSKRLHLTDLRLAKPEASIDAEVLARAADIFSQNPEKIAGMKLAIVANESFWRTAPLDSLLSRYNASVIAFNFLETACSWLGTQEEKTESIFRQLHVQLQNQANSRTSPT